MGFFADFHIHSKYSRATSSDMMVDGIARAAKTKGIKLMGTGDFTHPTYFRELQQKLNPEGSGLFKYQDTYFMLTTEVSNIYTKNDKIRKIHNVIFVPSFEDASAINNLLSRYGDLKVDGRPTIALDSEIMVRRIRDVAPSAFIVPAHVWTPWFSLFGANSGFDSPEECFGDTLENIFALETGLSSDPPMNWRWSSLDRFALISNSDAHSPRNIGREANYFECKLGYFDIIDAIKSKDKEKFKFTVEFFPQEGKYHYDGHRKCGTRISPEEAINNNNLCPKCGRPITVGVMHRVIDLSDRGEGFVPEGAIPCKHLITLHEIIGDALSIGKDSKGVMKEYDTLVYNFDNEFNVLLNIPQEELSRVTSHKIAEAIIKVREEKVTVLPGYDGVYGEIKIFEEEEQKEEGAKEEKQLGLFG
ncbi:MAG TPA: DNA helicase UvrD [bacterium (Candidatus Stahlbacteria)]|nr:DNA helicase UvrD [Candidatus Stahlbacteria bacterium]